MAEIPPGGIVLAAGLLYFERRRIRSFLANLGGTESSSGTQYTAGHLKQADPETFERLVAEAWEEKGYSTAVTQAGADDGVDVIANSEDETVMIQAKRYSNGNKVSSPVVREAVGAAQQMNADRAVIATSSDFTGPAYKAAANTDVDLQNGDDIAALLSD